MAILFLLAINVASSYKKKFDNKLKNSKTLVDKFHKK